MTPQDKLFDAVSAINEVAKDLQRRLQTEECSDGVDLTDAHNIAQIIQGAGFMALAMWLIFANNSKVAVAQKAPLEQRHAICATISTAVALFSGFFNILQLTAIDDFDLPGRENNFTLNLSRPIEWIATCPIMQLKLVVLAGSRVPSYRRFMMPLISVAVLLCGTASMFTGDALRFAWYGFGLSLACIMFYHNALQIKENSEGEESLFSGDSDFRKLSITLIVTWFPFPLWFSLSVEGFGLITDGFIIEMGWVALNIISKFLFIIWLQRMKMVHQRKIEAARELYGLSPSEDINEEELKVKALKTSSVNNISGVNADVDSATDVLTKAQDQTLEKMLASMRTDLDKLTTQGDDVLETTERSAKAQEERMGDVRRQNMMILDLLTSAERSMQSSAESLQNFTRGEIMRDSAANLEIKVREVIMQQMGKMQEAFLGGGEEGDENSFKAAVTSMVMRLEESAVRLEVASTPANNGQEQENMVENIRQELAALAMALSQQQREASQESFAQVGEALRTELAPLKDSQTQAAGALTEKVSELQESVAQSMSKFELGMDKVLQTVEASATSTKHSSQDKRSSRAADR